MIGGGMELELETGWERTWGTGSGSMDYTTNALLLAGNFAYNIPYVCELDAVFSGRGRSILSPNLYRR